MNADLPIPRVGCGAALLRDDRLLLVKRKRPPEADHWGLPGGKVDPFETVQDAVAREVFEELGIRIEPKRLLCVVDQIDRRANEHWIAPVYVVENVQGHPDIREPDALGGIGWFAISALPDPLTQATKRAVAALAEERR